MSPGYLLLYPCMFLSLSSAGEKTRPAAPQMSILILFSHHTDKKPCWSFLSCYKMSSFSESKWLKGLNRVFWFPWHFSAAQNLVDKSRFLCVRGATFTSTVWWLSSVLWIQNDNCSLLKTSSGIQSCQSHSCNQCVYKSMLQWLSGMLNACVEGKSDIRHVPVNLAVYCNLHRDELDTVSQQRYFYRFPVKAREQILLNCFCLSFDVRTLKVRLLWVQKMGKIHLRWLDGMTQFSILVGWVSRSGFHVAHVAVWANSHKGASVIDAGKNSGLLVREVSGTVRLAAFSLYLPVGVRGHCSLLLYPSKITNVMMSKSFQSCGRTNSCCLKEAEQVRQEGLRESVPKIPSSRGAREKRLSYI